MSGKQILIIALVSPLVALSLVGGLFYLLVMYSEYTDTHEGKPINELHCSEERNSYFCVIRSYIQPQKEEN